MRIRKSAVGEKYGKLTVVADLPYGGNSLKRVRCVCDCGNTWEGYLSGIKTGGTKTCGCGRAARTYQDTAPLVGRKYGRLEIIEELPRVRNGRQTYRRVLCKCDCGTVDHAAWLHSLKSGHAAGCGKCKRGGTGLLTAFGESKSPRSWARDPRCAVGYSGLVGRLHRGWPAEKALTAPAQCGQAGVPA